MAASQSTPRPQPVTVAQQRADVEVLRTLADRYRYNGPSVAFCCVRLPLASFLSYAELELKNHADWQEQCEAPMEEAARG